MYYDLRFPFRVSAEAALAQDENGDWVEAYALTTLKQCKAPMMTEEKYKEMHESQRKGLAAMSGMEPEWITCITPEEYETNMGDDEE